MPEKRVLVAYASKNGSTAEIAEAIGRELRLMGVDEHVLPVEQVEDVIPYDAVILGSAVYAWSWEKNAVKFAEENAEVLRKKPVWLFSSGPLDWSAAEGDVRPVRSARKIATLVGARGHITFGGKLPAETKGFLAKYAKKEASRGDFRDFNQIRQWTDGVGKIVIKLPSRTVVAAA